MDHDKPSGARRKDHPLYAPGLKWRSRVGGVEIPMWIPPGKDVRAGYLPKSLMLERTASSIELAEICRRQWKDLLDWREGKSRPARLSIAWLINRYLYDPLSPYHKLDPETQQSYRWECKRIRQTVGDRLLPPKKENGALVPRIVGEDFRRWHYNWGHPAPKEIKQPDGTVILIEQKPTPSRARHCMAMFRALASYNVEIATPGAVELRATLSAMKFQGSRRRVIAPTYEQVDAIVSAAEEMGYRSIAITTLAQFELIERRTHIIGKWRGACWGYGWVWEGQIQLDSRTEWVGVSADWRIRYYQTKKGSNLREFDLSAVKRLLRLIQLTPEESRHGPIIICEDTGAPWVKRRYQEKFREIARVAGVPDNIFSMDMRSGGASEADILPEVTDRMFDDAGGWTDPNMKHTYRRQKQRNAQKVVELRQAARNKP